MKFCRYCSHGSIPRGVLACICQNPETYKPNSIAAGNLNEFWLVSVNGVNSNIFPNLQISRPVRCQACRPASDISWHFSKTGVFRIFFRILYQAVKDPFFPFPELKIDRLDLKHLLKAENIGFFIQKLL